MVGPGGDDSNVAYLNKYMFTERGVFLEEKGLYEKLEEYNNELDLQGREQDQNQTIWSVDVKILDCRCDVRSQSVQEMQGLSIARIDFHEAGI